MRVYGEGAFQLVWQGFALGFGGRTASKGLFDLMNPGALAGFEWLVTLAREFSPSPESLGRIRSTPTMRFQFYGDVNMNVSPWRWARFPVMPKVPVIPVSYTGVRLILETATGILYEATKTDVSSWAQAAICQFARWRYAMMRRGSVPLGTTPPILRDAVVQDRYWFAPERAVAGASSVGAWRSFMWADAGWPPAASGMDPNVVVFDALAAAVAGSKPLAQSLGVAQAKLNDALRLAPVT